MAVELITFLCFGFGLFEDALTTLSVSQISCRALRKTQDLKRVNLEYSRACY